MRMVCKLNPNLARTSFGRQQRRFKCFIDKCCRLVLYIVGVELEDRLWVIGIGCDEFGKIRICEAEQGHRRIKGGLYLLAVLLRSHDPMFFVHSQVLDLKSERRNAVRAYRDEQREGCREIARCWRFEGRAIRIIGEAK